MDNENVVHIKFNSAANVTVKFEVKYVDLKIIILNEV